MAPRPTAPIGSVKTAAPYEYRCWEYTMVTLMVIDTANGLCSNRFDWPGRGRSVIVRYFQRKMVRVVSQSLESPSNYGRIENGPVIIIDAIKSGIEHLLAVPESIRVAKLGSNCYETRTMNIGVCPNIKTIICRYVEHLSLMKRKPDGIRCTAINPLMIGIGTTIILARRR